MGVEERLAAGQGAYYLTTGVWPLVDIRSFARATGPKADRRLARTVGVLVGVIGGVPLLAAGRRRPTPEPRLLAGGSAAGLAAIDVVFVTRRRIRPIYLGDAAVNLALAAGWAIAQARRGR